MQHTGRRRLLGGQGEMSKNPTGRIGKAESVWWPRRQTPLRNYPRQAGTSTIAFIPTSNTTPPATTAATSFLFTTSTSPSTTSTPTASNSASFSLAVSGDVSFDPVNGVTVISGVTQSLSSIFTSNSIDSTSSHATITTVVAVSSASAMATVTAEPSLAKKDIGKPIVIAIVMVVLLLIGVCCFLKCRGRRRQRRRRFIEQSPTAFTVPSTASQASNVVSPSLSRDPSKTAMLTTSTTELGRLTIPSEPSYTATLRNETTSTPSEPWSDSVTAVSRGVFYPPPPRPAPAPQPPRIGITNPDPFIENPPLLARDLHPTAFAASPVSPQALPSSAAAAKLKEAEAGLLTWRVDAAPGSSQASGSATDDALRAEVDALRREVERLRAREAERSAEEGERPPAYGLG